MERTPTMTGLSARAVAAGVLFDIAGTIVFGLAFAFIAAVLLASKGADPETIEAYLAQSVVFQILNLANGLFFTAAGAYLAGRIAGRDAMRHALAVGIVSTVLGAVLVMALPDAAPLWYSLVSLSLLIPAALLGGRIRVASARREAAARDAAR